MFEKSYLLIKVKVSFKQFTSNGAYRTGKIILSGTLCLPSNHPSMDVSLVSFCSLLVDFFIQSSCLYHPELISQIYINRISERCTVSKTKIWQHSEGILSDPRVSVLYLLYSLLCRMIGFRERKKKQRRGVAYSINDCL